MVKFTVSVPAPTPPHKLPMVFPHGMACETDDFEIMLGRLTIEQVIEIGTEYTNALLKNWSDQTGIPLERMKHNYTYDLEDYTPKRIPPVEKSRRGKR